MSTSTASAKPAVDTPTSSSAFPPPPLTPTFAGSSKTTVKSVSKSTHKPPSATRAGKARQLLKWDWLEPAQRAELEAVLISHPPDADGDSIALPKWFKDEYQDARNFTWCRSRLWKPEDGEARENPKEWLDDKAHRLLKERNIPKQDVTPRLFEQAQDEVCRDVWKTYDEEGKNIAILASGFLCIRHLGWRQGYSAGHPLDPSHPDYERQQRLVEASRIQSPKGARAQSTLNTLEDEIAWDAWCQLTEQQRAAEEDLAWQDRDRSLLYADDSAESSVLGRPIHRWYDTPQRVGSLTWLPNFDVRLVKNGASPGKRGGADDPWKATFRVPLNMHKHSVKSYLLAIYGLKTTWIRSMIYRVSLSARGRDRRGTYKKVEVGLLEPFIFPAMSDNFRNEFLLAREMDAIKQRMLLKIDGHGRWRGGKIIPPAKPALTDPPRSKGSDEFELERTRKIREGIDVRKPTIATFSGLFPTKSHKNILKTMLNKKRERMRVVDEKAMDLGNAARGELVVVEEEGEGEKK